MRVTKQDCEAGLRVALHAMVCKFFGEGCTADGRVRCVQQQGGVMAAVVFMGRG